MNESLNQYLDGELEAEQLTPEAGAEAQAWEALFADARQAGAAGAPVGLESRIMDELRAERKTPVARIVDWWVSPRPVRVRPLIGLAAAAAIGALFFLPIGDGVVEAPVGAMTTMVGEQPVYVQFQLEAPDAATVAVGGDFSDWEARLELVDPDGDGTWSGRLLLPPGVHQYMFLVNGTDWIADPLAEQWVEDGFGNRNSVLAITGGAGAGSLAP
ncbi:MAG: glycogen-binding domain-containing protein [Gemmatimonadota bacterium]|nr:glycogen-binding domain-containing protein [Gemmatimonadota bacterium]